MFEIFSWIETFVFIILFLQVGYLSLFALASVRRVKSYPVISKGQARFAVFFPAYKEDRVIVQSVIDFLNQDYPRDRFDLYVLSDQMKSETIEQLSTLPIYLIPIHLKESSKAKALSFAVEMINQEGRNYDFAVIMDADNVACSDFLSQINDAISSGFKAIQGHRVAKNLNSSIAVLDAISEEINNSIFRQGQVNLGFSSALIGSGMALEYNWFKSHIGLIDSMGEDKELERMLLKESIYTEYLPMAWVYDEKISSQSGFYNQRRRWLAAQLFTIKLTIKDLPIALFSGNWDYFNKILQWMLLPRILLLGMIVMMTCAMLFLDLLGSFKWVILLLVMVYSLAIATPDRMITKEFRRSMFSIPSLFLLMVANLFRIRGANKTFIHTEHKH